VKKKASSRPKLPKVCEEMKAWSAALGSEITGWPQVSTRSFFGFTALYRRDRIFALLPCTRGMETANSLAFKFDRPAPAARARLDQDPRIASTHMGKARWYTFELSSDSDLRSALDWLGTAYEAAGKNKKSG
jgi:predicted DNA-binding protein (MmcQ/YjbR family)